MKIGIRKLDLGFRNPEAYLNSIDSRGVSSEPSIACRSLSVCDYEIGELWMRITGVGIDLVGSIDSSLCVEHRYNDEEEDL